MRSLRRNNGDLNGSGPLEAENIHGRRGSDVLPGIQLQTSRGGEISVVGGDVSDREHVEA